MLAWYSIRILNFTEASLYTYIYKLLTLTRLTDRHWHCNSEQNSVNKIRLCLSVKAQNTLLDWLQTMDSGLFVWRDCDTWHMLRCYNLLRLWCRSGTGVSREMMRSAEPHKYDLWWSNRFERGELSLWDSDELGPIIHLINIAVTDVSRLVNYFSDINHEGSRTVNIFGPIFLCSLVRPSGVRL